MLLTSSRRALVDCTLYCEFMLLCRDGWLSKSVSLLRSVGLGISWTIHSLVRGHHNPLSTASLDTVMVVELLS